MKSMILFAAVFVVYTSGRSQLTQSSYVIDQGGGTGAGGELSVTSSIGQPIVIGGTGSGFSLEGGFIPVVNQLTGAAAAISVALDAGWNMISVPLTLGDYRKTILFPTVTSNVFAYTPQGYLSVDTLRNGVGYWIKLIRPQSAEYYGWSFDHDTIDVVLGWNLIGSVSRPVAVDQIASLPGGMITSQIYGYTSTGYFGTDSLRPGLGYWVKVNQNGKLLLSANGAEGMTQCVKIIPTPELPPEPPGPRNAAVDGEENLPKTFSLQQNFPNPFNPVTVLRFGLPYPSHVSVEIHSILGQQVATLVNGWQEAGYQSVEWNAEKVPSGIYFCRMIAGSFSAVRKMVVLK